MVVMMLDRVSSSLRGELTRWLLEPKPGVFVGTISAMVRDRLWVHVCRRMGPKAGGILVCSAANEQGFEMRLWGTPNRTVVDFDGLWLVLMPQDSFG